MRQGIIAIALAVAAGSFGWFKAGVPSEPASMPGRAPSQSGAAPRPVEHNVIAYSATDAAMTAAETQGRATLPRFRELIAARAPGTYSVKFALTQNGATEHIWMQLTDAPEGKFVGVLANEPVNGHRYRMGDPVTVPDANVEDWMVRTEADIYGGYTARVALKDMPEQEADEYAPLFRD